MLNIDFIRKNVELVKQNVLDRGFDPKKADIEKLLQLDQERNAKQLEIDKLRQRRNEIADSMKQTGGKPPMELITEGRELKEKVAKLETELQPVNDAWQLIMDWIPNLAWKGVPVGKDPSGNEEVKAWTPEKGYVDSQFLKGPDGSKSQMSQKGSNADDAFEIKPHWEIGKALDIIDLEAGAKVSGSRFYYLKKDAWLMAYGIFDLLIKKLLSEDFIPMYVPVLVKDRALYGTSHFPADQDQVYKIESKYVEGANQLNLIGSSEPALFAYFMDTVLEAKDLPAKMFALTSCFRSEAGSWGKDVRGIKRVHQFDKLEMDVVIENDAAKAEEMHEYLLGINEWLLQLLELPYHVINMCTADLGYAAASKKYDVEVWLPSDNTFMEVMSDSITGDFQTRRLNIKYKDATGNRNLAYTINNTGATHRLLIAILDHYQQEDGSVKVPKALHPYLNKTVLGKNA